ncbi:PREDICTED: uncharacterized protein LOC108380406 [Rhagoletis zephyria]|uniref:uncharacterized protein LOC108380406 n=1 Tax=Rhagoletis zephyria TaxID=28612 RepID=UPI000811776C|nr:PREDICTED: uncharacterized protein LOC108380406 [Rhagoletis zephyria]
MRFLKISILNIFTLIACVSLTTAAVICIDDSSLDKRQAADGGKVNEQQTNATAAASGEDETAAEFDGVLNNHTDLSGSFNGSHHGQSQVTQFLQTVQDTLEKAKPWVVELEKEAKRLEETAKRFGEGVIRGLGSFVDRLIGGGGGGHGSIVVKPANFGEISTSSPVNAPVSADDKSPPPFDTTTATAAAVAEVLPDFVAAGAADAAVDAAAAAANDAENEISGQQDDNALCPDGFVAEVNGICLRNHK